MATTKSSTVKAAPSATPAAAFFDTPLSLITVAAQIRSRIDQEGEAFLALVESIREKGVLESVIVTPRDGKYLLIAGERRLLACQKLELPTIPARVKKEVADTVSAIMNISGKSLRSVQRACSLLKLPEEIQNAIREGLIGVSQGYIFAANLDHPLLIEIFQKAIGEGFTNAALEKELKKGLKPATTTVRKKSFSLYRGSVQSLRTGIEGQGNAFRKSDLEALLNDLRELITVVEGRLPEAIDDGGPAVEAPQKKAVLA
jgi:ParB-like chromosome segregation protein Spo0J